MKVYIIKDEVKKKHHIHNDGQAVVCGVMVYFDDDFDERILDYVRELPACCLECLIAVQEHEGSLTLFVKEEECDGLSDPYEHITGDYWEVEQVIIHPTEMVCYTEWIKETK